MYGRGDTKMMKRNQGKAAKPQSSNGKPVGQVVPCLRDSSGTHATEKLAEPLSRKIAHCNQCRTPAQSGIYAHHLVFRNVCVGAFRADFKPFDAAFRVLFNSYYNAVGDKHPRPERGLISRPDLQRVRDYRRHVTAAIERAVIPSNQDEIRTLVTLGCHHEEQHQELILTGPEALAAEEPLKPAYQTLAAHACGVAERALACYEGELGRGGTPRPRFRSSTTVPTLHKHWLEPYELASHPVTR